MKKLLLCTVILLVSSLAFCMSVTRVEETNDYDSIPMLENFYGKEAGRNPSYYENVKISLVTISKGDPLYTWFGHAGIVIEEPNREDVMYDWGRFVFEPEFYKNFAKGNLMYNCGRFYAANELKEAANENRTIRRIELNLTNEQKKDIINFVNTNSSDLYNTYRYDMFTDNCATRIRDLINASTDGRFEAWAKKQSGYTFREQISKVYAFSIPLNWAADFVLGPMGDKKATLWDEMFIPANLADAVSEFENIAKDDSYINDTRETDTRQKDAEVPQTYVHTVAIVGIALALLTAFFYAVMPRFYKIEMFLVNFVFGLMGLLLLYLMTYSNHTFSFFNENILFINPLLLFCAFFSLKAEKHKHALKGIYSVLSTLIIILIVCKVGIRNVFCQNNYGQIITVLPYYLVNILLLNKKSDN